MSNITKRPNIVFIFSDQQRADTLGCYGQKLDVTPNLDRLAKDGVRFEKAYTCQPVCGPARSCLQSGQYATETGCFINGRPLPTDIPTVAKSLSAAGYETAYVGKWHLASHHHKGILYQNAPVPAELRGGFKDYIAMADVLEFSSHGYDGHVWDKDGQRMDFIGYRADCLTDYAIHYIRNKESDAPFYMFISYLEPHHQNDTNNYECPDGYREKFKDVEIPYELKHGMYEGDWHDGRYADYIGCCHAVDYNVGRLVDTLKEKGIYDDTVIVYTSDHGDHFETMNGEHKRQCFDSCLRVPLIIKGAGDFCGGITKTEPVSLINLPPTLLEMAGTEIPSTFQERPLQDLMEGKSWSNCVFYQISEAELARGIRTERWKYCVHAPHVQGVLDMGARYDANYYRSMLKKAKPYSDDYVEQYLFDTYNDPYELNNLIAEPEYADIRAELRATLADYIRRAEHRDAVIYEYGHAFPEACPEEDGL